MTTYMRWQPGTLGQLEYFEMAKVKWVPATREMYRFFLANGPVHMNPSVNPATALLAEMRSAK